MDVVLHGGVPGMSDDLEETLKLGLRVKRALQRKGKTRGWTKCPRCGGKIHAILAGHRQHLHMICETKSCISLME